MPDRERADDLARLNAWRDGLESPPGEPAEVPPALRAQWSQVERELQTAFNPERAADAAQRARAALAAEQQAESPAPHEAGKPPGPSAAPTAPRRLRFPRYLLLSGAAAALVASVVVNSYFLAPAEDDGPFRKVAPTAAYRELIKHGFRPDWVCTVEEFPGAVSEHFDGKQVALAPLPPDVELLGWTEPYYTGSRVLHPDELLLLVRVGGEPLIVLMAERAAAEELARAPADDLRVHVVERAEFLFVEVSPLASPRITPLIETH